MDTENIDITMAIIKGWTPLIVNGLLRGYLDKWGAIVDTYEWRPSEDISDAMQIVELYQDNGFVWTFDSVVVFVSPFIKKIASTGWNAILYELDKDSGHPTLGRYAAYDEGSGGSSLPMAICMAAKYEYEDRQQRNK